MIANSQDVKSSNGGGSGGSILIFTHALSGSHTGAIQALGGTGNAGSGGGSGGRVAAYYSNKYTHHPYRGSYDVYGGKGISGAEAGASGTVYLKHIESGHSILKVNNNEQKSLTDVISNEGERLELSGGNVDRSQSYKSPSGVTVTTNCAIADCYWSHGSCSSCQDFSLAHLFEQTYSSGRCDIFVSRCSSANLVFDLKRLMFVNHIRVYPTCNYPSNFQVRITKCQTSNTIYMFFMSLLVFVSVSQAFKLRPVVHTLNFFHLLIF